MRTKRTLYTTISSLILQMVTAICGMILPRMILAAFGSEVNGAISSITQFLGYISMLEVGVGGVTRAALYKPLAEGNGEKLSAIINATKSFFRKIGVIFAIYVIVIACGYQYIVDSNLTWLFTFSLVLIISISTFAQYFFGMPNTILLRADQKSYIINTVSILTVVVNTILSAILLCFGASIHLIKLVGTTVYVIRPLFLWWYCKRNYQLDRTVPKDDVAIKQRWNGFGHHVAFFAYSNTDVFVITLFLGLKWVSVYTIYGAIVFGMRSFINAISGAAESALGDIIAKDEQKALEHNFAIIETITSVITLVLFSTTGLLLFDFIAIYTKSIQDVNYIVPAFGVLFVFSEALNAIKQPYYNLIAAAGHYKQTRAGAYIEAAMNFVLSVIFVQFWGIEGVLVATIISSMCRFIYYACYFKKNIIKRKISVFWARQSVNVITAIVIVLLGSILPFGTPSNYGQWAMKAIVVLLMSSCITFAIQFLFYKKELLSIKSKLVNTILR